MVKPDLDNLGEAIRQLRQASNGIKKGGMTDFHLYSHDIHHQLVTEFSQPNVDLINESTSILHKYSCVISTYCSNTNEFYLFSTKQLKTELIEKHGNPLDCM